MLLPDHPYSSLKGPFCCLSKNKPKKESNKDHIVQQAHTAEADGMTMFFVNALWWGKLKSGIVSPLLQT